MKIYATVGDCVETKLNKQGVKEYFTVEGQRVISDVDVGEGELFRKQEIAIRAQWPNCVIRFEKDKKNG
jgi:hypothetical protein